MQENPRAGLLARPFGSSRDMQARARLPGNAPWAYGGRLLQGSEGAIDCQAPWIYYWHQRNEGPAASLWDEAGSVTLALRHGVASCAAVLVYS